jgi:hypothetical protein
MSGGKISLSLGGSKKPAPSNGVKRPHAALRDHEPEDGVISGATQRVSHFDRDAGGAVDDSRIVEDKCPLVIAPQHNRDWKEASVRNKRLRYAQVADAERARNDNEEVDVEAKEASKPVFGLNIAKRKDDEATEATNGHATTDGADGPQDSSGDHSNDDPPIKQLTADEEAMNALLGNAKQPSLVLPAMSEEQAFERDYQSAPDMASLADYDRVPVEEFGAALLRGMGWKDGEGIGANRGKKLESTKIPKRRPALLGIGAKEEAAVAEEMGAWGKAARYGGKNGEIKIYNPVLLRDKRTGEMLTEEEVEKRKAQEERQKYELEFEKKEGKRDDRNGDRDRDSRRDKERQRDDDRDRRKHEDSDEEYYRRKKEKERRRRERDDGEYDRDRDRSRRNDSDRDRRHDSDRDRRKERHRDRRH